MSTMLPKDDPATPCTGKQAMAIIRNAMDWQAGDGAELPGDPLFEQDGFTLTQTAFRFITPGGVCFYYVLGGQVTVALPDNASMDEMQLYLWGTVLGAVAWLNGFFPLHASAVAHGDYAIGFTGPAGAGKSTLAAALGKAGMAHICDDTLVAVPCGECLLALPDGKRAKLWGDALEMLGLAASAAIAPVPGKYFADVLRPVRQAVPLRHLIFLEEGPQVAFEPVTGSAKLALLPSALYRDFVYAARADQSAHETMMLGFARHVQFWRLRRPRDAAGFGRDVQEIAALITGLP